jgi:alpha-D-xyloside xylohydrolase
LFVRHGAVIPVADVADFVGDAPFPELTMVCWDVTGPARTVIRDVDGDTTVVATREGARCT